MHLRLEGRHNAFALGGEFKNGSIDGGDHYVTSTDEVLNKGSIRILSVFAQDELSLFNKKIWLQVALRYDNAYFHKGWFEANGEKCLRFQHLQRKAKK